MTTDYHKNEVALEFGPIDVTFTASPVLASIRRQTAYRRNLTLYLIIS